MKVFIVVLQRVGDFLDRCASMLAALTFLIMSLLVIMQVISRCFLDYSFQWAEEMARYLFIWSTMLAAACATRTQLHIGVDILVSYAKGNLKLIMRMAAQVFLIAAVVIFIIYGGEQAKEAFVSGQTATSFPVSAGVLYLSIPCSGLLMLLYSFTQLLELICFGDYRKTTIQTF